MFSRMNNDINYYKNALDGTWERNKAISSNISNVNTPDYKRKYVTFEDQLMDKMENYKKTPLTITHKNHIGYKNQNFTPMTLIDRRDGYRLDGNNVNIDTESAELAKNTIMYDAISRQVSSEFEKIKNVLTEGSK